MIEEEEDEQSLLSSEVESLQNFFTEKENKNEKARKSDLLEKWAEPEDYQTSLTSERLGVNVLTLMKERKQKLIEKNKSYSLSKAASFFLGDIVFFVYKQLNRYMEKQ
jgi:hypothetical protein